MNRQRTTALLLATCALLITATACSSGPAITGNFDRTFALTGHTRLEISTASGDINITGSADNKAHIHGDVRISGIGAVDANKKMADIVTNPPLEQTPDGLRIGRDSVPLHNVSISYTIEVPRDTEVAGTSASGSETVRDVRGPIKLQSASGAVRAENIDGEAQLVSASGTVTATNMGDVVRASSLSGDVTVNIAKGDVRAKDTSGNISITKPGARVEAEDTSGNVDVQGATSDAKAHSISGNVSVRGNPSTGSDWDLKTISGNADIGVASGANFHFLAESSSSEIRADIPIIIEEQGKHSLRAQIGTGGGRVEAHSVSGGIHLSPFQGL